MSRSAAPPPSTTRPRLLARAGQVLGALGVFTCAWLTMRTDDWRRMALFTGLALLSAGIASAFSRRV